MSTDYQNPLLNALEVEHEKTSMLQQIDTITVNILRTLHKLPQGRVSETIATVISISAPFIPLVLTFADVIEVTTHVLGIILLYNLLLLGQILHTLRYRLFLQEKSPPNEQYDHSIKSLNKLKWVYALREISWMYLLLVILVFTQLVFENKEFKNLLIFMGVVYMVSGLYLMTIPSFVEEIFARPIRPPHAESMEGILRNPRVLKGLYAIALVLALIGGIWWLWVIKDIISITMIIVYTTVTILFGIMLDSLSGSFAKRILQEQLDRLEKLRDRLQNSTSLSELQEVETEMMHIIGFTEILIKRRKLGLIPVVEFTTNERYLAWLNQNKH